MHNSKCNEEVVKLIKDYIACSRYLCRLLKERVDDNTTILRAVRINKIPKEGYLDGGVYYKIHGVGCYFELPNTIIDVDFGPDDKVDGFDLFRLIDFHKSKMNDYPELSDEVIEKQFHELIENKIIYNPKSLPSPHLYYFTD